MRSIFGWSYPPGAANDPSAPYNQVDPPCGVCGHDCEACICPECPVCGAQGDPGCYDAHGLERTPAQVDSLREAEARWEAENAALSEAMFRAYGSPEESP